jgi:hypothetical protein
MSHLGKTVSNLDQEGELELENEKNRILNNFPFLDYGWQSIELVHFDHEGENPEIVGFSSDWRIEEKCYLSSPKSLSK